MSWSGAPADSTSTIVEFATEPDGRYTILDFTGANQQSFKHPDLMPKTPFYYRVTPVLGPASSPVEVKLPTATTFHPITETTTPNAPTQVTIKSIGTNAVRVTWKDNAPDEDGYLLEIKPQGQPHFRVAGFIDPNTTSTDLTTLPPERTATYQLRTFHRGTPSNLAHQTTGGD